MKSVKSPLYYSFRHVLCGQRELILLHYDFPEWAGSLFPLFGHTTPSPNRSPPDIPACSYNPSNEAQQSNTHPGRPWYDLSRVFPSSCDTNRTRTALISSDGRVAKPAGQDYCLRRSWITSWTPLSAKRGGGRGGGGGGGGGGGRRPVSFSYTAPSLSSCVVPTRSSGSEKA